MTTNTCKTLPSSLLHPVVMTLFFGTFFAATLLSANAALASNVVDEGKFFSADTIRSADEKLQELRQHHGFIINVETIAELPGDESDRVAQMPKSERAKFFGHFLAKRAAAEKIDLLIFASRNPHYLQVLPHKKLESAGFTETMRDKLASELIAGFHAKKYDEALSAAVAQLQHDFTTIHRATAAPHASSPVQAPFHPEDAIPRQESETSWLGPALIVGAIVVVVLLIRRLFKWLARRLSRRWSHAGSNDARSHVGRRRLYGQHAERRVWRCGRQLALR